MSSTVTTTVVTMLTTATNLDFAAGFTLICVLLLGCLLLGKEVAMVGQDVRTRRFARGLDIATAPLLIAFATILVLRMVDFFGG